MLLNHLVLNLDNLGRRQATDGEAHQEALSNDDNASVSCSTDGFFSTSCSSFNSANEGSDDGIPADRCWRASCTRLHVGQLPPSSSLRRSSDRSVLLSHSASSRKLHASWLWFHPRSHPNVWLDTARLAPIDLARTPLLYEPARPFGGGV